MSLRQVLDAFRQSEPLSMTQLAKKLNVDLNTLDDMLQFWVRKGKLREVRPNNCGDCGGIQHCPVKVAVPRRYELVAEGESANAAPACPHCTPR